MSASEAATPRVFLIRHGETVWAKSGRYTGITDIELTPNGVRQAQNTGRQLVGPGKLIDPARVAHVWLSPRKRAQQTFHLIFKGDGGDSISTEKITSTEDIGEWGYGIYEGLKLHEIQAGRRGRGLDKERDWDIWKDGCEDGESPPQVTQRLDRLVAQVRQMQAPCMHGEQPADVVLIAHSHILRGFVKRWVGYPIDDSLPMMLSPGAVCVLSYRDQDVHSPAFYVGMALPPPKE